MNSSVLLEKARKTLVVPGLLSAVALTANAGSYVFKNTSKNDPRFVIANTTFSNVIDRAASAGLWVKDITPDTSHMSDLAAVFGCRHVNQGIEENGFSVFFQGQSKLSYNLRGQDASGANVAYRNVAITNDLSWCSDGNWHFIFFTCDCDAKQVKAYLDGVCIHTKAITLETFSPVRSYAFGGGMGKKNECDKAERDGTTASWVGYFAEATVFDRVLTDAEVAELATRRVKYDAVGLLAYWPCNESTGNPVNWAKNPAHRADGTEACAYAYYVGHEEDADFFSMPSGYFVVSPEWAEENDYVMAAGCAANTLAKPATNIQYALDKATADGGIVNLLPGTYYPTAKLQAKCNSLLLRSYNPTTDGYDREGTILDGSKMASDTMIFDNNSKTGPTIDSLTFCNTAAARGIYLKSAGAYRVLNSTFTNLTLSTAAGGGIYSYTSNGGLVSNCLFKSCSAAGGGGIYTIQNVFGENDFCTVQDCTFIGDKADLGTSDDGKCGGAVYGSRNIHVLDCVFRDNAATFRGGHLVCGKYAIVSGCTFGGSAGSRYGSAVFGFDGYATISNCQFVGATSGDGFGYLHPAGNTLIVDCVVTNNGYTAPFVFNERGSDVVVRQCLFADNAQSIVVTGHNSTSAFVENCTVAMTGEMKGVSDTSSKDVFVNCILCGTVTSSSSHQAIVSNCTVKALGGTPHPENFNAYVGRNPGFKDVASGDYSLKDGAFARDKGLRLGWMADSSLDLARNPRLVNRDGVAYAADAMPDLGCFEVQEPAPGMILVVR